MLKYEYLKDWVCVKECGEKHAHTHTHNQTLPETPSHYHAHCALGEEVMTDTDAVFLELALA